MKQLLVILDGALPEEMTSLSTLSFAPEKWFCCHTPSGFSPDSLCCILTILGGSPEHIPPGRAFLEAAAAGMNPRPGDLAFRCNRVVVEEGRLLSAQGKETKWEEWPPVFAQGKLCWTSLEGYKGLLLAKGQGDLLPLIRTFPPHDHVGEPVEPLLPDCPGALGRCLKTLAGSLGLWPWGQAAFSPLPSFETLHGFPGGAVCRTEVVRGMALAMGMACPLPAGATADWDTDLAEKGRLALSLLDQYPFVMLHLNGGDECAHRRDQREKERFFQRVDGQLLAPLLSQAPQDLCLTVTADHGTSSRTGRHIAEPVLCCRFGPSRCQGNQRLILDQF